MSVNGDGTALMGAGAGSAQRGRLDKACDVKLGRCCNGRLRPGKCRHKNDCDEGDEISCCGLDLLSYEGFHLQLLRKFLIEDFVKFQSMSAWAWTASANSSGCLQQGSAGEHSSLAVGTA
jgi:hypothetical protein